MRKRVLQVASLVILLALVQVGSGNPNTSYLPSQAITYFPDTDWTATTPEEQGMNSTVLAEMLQFVEDEDPPIKGLVVTRNGYIVEEEYWNYNTETSTHHIFSCTKSFTAALIGIALKEGFLDNVSQRVLDFFPEMTVENPDVRKDAMTIEDLLTMRPGVDWNEHNISYDDPTNMYQQMFGSPNPVQFFLDLPMTHDPGTYWVYSTGASHMLSAILQEATGMSTYDFADDYLFEPLNMTIGGWSVDPQGINIGGTLLYVSVRTMAKLGLLYLNNGTWNGQEIISEEYIAQSHYPHTSSEYSGYGYQWWIDFDSTIFNARGSEGQYIHVVPEHNIVVAMTQNADEYGEDVNRDILEYVLDSLVNDTTSGTTTGTGMELLIPIIGVGAVVVVVVAVIYIRKT
ncbi:MAG: serine hydrolase domain-containing protein [Candidatus Thorarchaeota archaeon]